MRDYHLSKHDASLLVKKELEIHHEVNHSKIEAATDNDVIKNVGLTVKIPELFYELLQKVHGKNLSIAQILEQELCKK